jgi:fibronectin-binding autotransporter adhesin
LGGSGNYSYSGGFSSALWGLRVALGAGGQQTLTGTNTYAGATTVSSGSLWVNGSIASTVAVSGGTFGGTGVVSNSVTVNSGGTLSPGVSIGTLTINGNLTLSGGNTMVELDRSLSPAQSNDMVNVTGTVTYGGTLTVNNLGPAPQAGDSFTLFTAAASAGSFASVNLPALASGQNWWTPDNYATLTVNQVNAGAATYTRSKGASLKIAIADLLTHVTSTPSGDTPGLASVGPSTNGASITSNGSWIFYSATNSSSESFPYSVTSARGGSATGMITVNVTPSTGPTLSLDNVNISGGTATISVFGIPNYAYALQTTTNAPGDGPWWSLSTNTAAANGALSFIDSSATNAQQYYRIAVP